MSLAVVHSRALAGMDAPPVTVEVHLGQRPAELHHRRAARGRGEGGEGPRARRAAERALRVSGAAHHRQPRARRPAQGIGPFRPADRARHPGRVGAVAGASRWPAASLPASWRLTGELRPVRGALAMALSAAPRAAALSCCPRPTRARRRWSRRRPSTRRDHCWKCAPTSPGARRSRAAPRGPRLNGCRHPDLLEVKGQLHAKRALEIAAAGGHSLLMVGPPGTGKSMLAERLPGILPPMTRGRGAGRGGSAIARQRGLRHRELGQAPVSRAAPHRLRAWRWWAAAASRARARSRWRTTACCSSTSCRSSTARCWRCCASRSSRAHQRLARRAPGRVSRRVPAGGGDEPLPLRLPRPSQRPLPLHAGPGRALSRAISGPLLDRIDLQIEVPDVPQEDLTRRRGGRGFERDPRASRRGPRAAAHAAGQAQRATCPRAKSIATAHRTRRARPLLKQAISRLGLSARGYHRVLKVARTIADLAGAQRISPPATSRKRSSTAASIDPRITIGARAFSRRACALSPCVFPS